MNITLIKIQTYLSFPIFYQFPFSNYVINEKKKS